MACVIEETNNLLAPIDYLVVAYATGISQSHSTPFGILNDILDAYQEILYFPGLLADGLGQNNVEAVRIGALGPANHGHVVPLAPPLVTTWLPESTRA